MTKSEVVALLRDCIAIPSVSTQQKYKKDIDHAVHFFSETLKKIGFTIHIFSRNTASPLIIASYSISPKAKTLGIYGHYDVQPAEPLADWKSPPFTLTLRDGALYGRGIADDKGHIIQNIAAIATLIKEKKLQHNIVFILEGEEEIGSSNLVPLLTQAKNILQKCDAFFVTDVGMHAKQFPQIFYALRGLVYFELRVSIGTRDLHSGVYGNRVKNAAQVAMHLISTMKDVHTGKVLIRGFSDDVRAISKRERKLLMKIKRSDEEEKKEAGVYDLMSLDEENPSLSSKIFPSLDVNGMISGFTEEGQKTVIPHEAIVKFSTRLVENQKPETIIKCIRQHVEKYVPTGVKYELSVLSADDPFYTSIDTVFVSQTAEALEKVFHNKIIFNRSGGSIPAAEAFQKIFSKPVVLTGFTLPNDNIHAPNENFDEEMFWKGIEALKEIYSKPYSSKFTKKGYNTSL